MRDVRKFRELLGELEHNEAESDTSNYNIDVHNQNIEEFCFMHKNPNLDRNDIVTIINN